MAQVAPAPSWLYTKIEDRRASKANPDPRPSRKLALNIGAICHTPPTAHRCCPGSGAVGKKMKPTLGAVARGISVADAASADWSGGTDAWPEELWVDALAAAVVTSDAAPIKALRFMQLLCERLRYARRRAPGQSILGGSPSPARVSERLDDAASA